MRNENIFQGTGARPTLAFAVYQQLCRREEVTYLSVLKSSGNYREGVKLLQQPNYGELKKAFGDVRKALKERCGKDCIVETGNNRNKTFRYVGEDAAPLADMVNTKVIKDLSGYYQFCQDSAGFFPISWLDYFFQGTRALLDIKSTRQHGEQVLSSSIDRSLKNINLLPQLYEAIIQRRVLSVDYKAYDKPACTYIVHPHFLKEYNGRWFLFCHVEDKEPANGYNLALDRIAGIPQTVPGHVYHPAPQGFYSDYFSDIVGVSHEKGADSEDICIRAYDYKVFKLIETKKFHPSLHVTVPFGAHEDGDYGDFVLCVEVNNELLGQILLYGDALEVMSPSSVRARIAQKVNLMQQRYAPEK